MTRRIALTSILALLLSCLGGCGAPGGGAVEASPPHGAGAPSGAVENILLVPGSRGNPSIIETKGFGLKVRIKLPPDDGAKKHRTRPSVDCYVAYIDSGSRVRFREDGSFRVDCGAIYVDSDCDWRRLSAASTDQVETLVSVPIDEQPPEINAYFYPPPQDEQHATTPVAEPDDWVWVSTSRVGTGAEGCAIAVQVEKCGYHRVFFLKGDRAYVIVAGQYYAWTDTQLFQEIDVWRTRREKSLAKDQAVAVWLKGLKARAAAAGLPPA